MEIQTILIIGLALILIVGAIIFLLSFFSDNSSVNRSGNMKSLMGAHTNEMSAAQVTKMRKGGVDVEEIKKQTGSSEVGKKKDDSLEARLFKAGYYSKSDQENFKKNKIVLTLVLTISFTGFLYYKTSNPNIAILGAIVGVIGGMIGPSFWLDREIKNRQEDMLYYLPLVIEQISIGVSSALDIGPCIANIVEMANERNSHNPVTVMFVQVERLIKSGLNLEGALVEVAEASGLSEIKHAFMFLAQCAKHGGELSKQLQELADTVMTQRQVQVEAKITSLAVKATGPLAMVFAGFFAILFAGLLVKLLSAFDGMGMG